MRLIDADALNEAMYRKSFETDDGRQRWDGGLWIRYKVFEEARDEAPTIDAEPARHGKWLHPEEDDEDYHTVSCSCSVCGWKFNLYEDDIDGAPYCAVCGAKMEPVSPLYQVDGAVEEGQTAEAVPEVRCKDCKYFTPGRYVGAWGMCAFDQSAMPECSSCFDGVRKAEP